MPLTKNEAAYIAAFLEELDDRFSNDGCNDMSLPNTPENREMLLAAEKQWAKDNDCEDELESDEEILKPSGRGKKSRLSTHNQSVLGYLQRRLMEEYGIKDKDDLPSTQEI